MKTRITIGMVSRLENGKGQDILIEAASLLKNKLPNFKVVIVGEGESKFLINLISKYKLEKIVKLTGYKKDIYKLMQTFDVFVFPTRWLLEGFGLVCLEAMAAKVPLVATNFGPVPEVVGKAGVLVEPNPEAVARGILKVIKSPELAAALVKKGSLRVRKYFDIKNIASRYEKI